MSYELTDQVPGLTDEQVAAATREAQVGYELDDRAAEPSPHFRRLHVVPEDLLAAIDERARRDGLSPDAIIRQALAAYLNTA